MMQPFAELPIPIEELPFPVAVLDRDMRYVAASARWLNDNKLEGPLLGRLHDEVFPSLPEQWRVALGPVLNGASVAERIDRLGEEGAFVWLKWQARPWREANDAIAGIILFAQDVTAQKHADEQSRLFVSLAENSREFIGICDAQFKPFYVNDAALRMVGLRDLEEATRTPVKEFFFPEDQPFIMNEFFPRVLREGRGEVKIRFRHFVTGAELWMVYSVFALTDEAGRTTGFATVSRNITEERNARLRLVEAQRRLRAITDAAPIGIAYADDASCAHITGNPAFLAQFEMDPDDNLSPAASEPAAFGRRVRYFREGRELTMSELPLQRAVAEGKQIPPVEVTVLLPNGRRWTAEASAAPILGEKGEIIGGVAVTVDITERQKRDEALRQSEERFRAVFQHAPTGIAITDWEGRFRQANPAFCRLLGYTHDELLTVSFGELVHPDDRAENLAGVDLLRNGELEFFETENRYVKKNGDALWVHKFVSLLHDKSGAPAHIVALVTDVTERRRMEEALRESDHRKDEFIATLAHELRNPLATISNVSHIIGANGDIAERQKLSAMIERQVKHLVRLVDDLLEVSRISCGKIELKSERVVVSEAIDQALEICAPILRRQRHEVRLSLGDTPLIVNGDAVRLCQVFANLLTNAAKYTEPGGRIDITAQRRDGEAVVSVRDTGVGIPAEMLSRVFDIFTQLDRDQGRSQGGLGIGLTLVRSLVHLHGGRVEARSGGPGQGSEFIVYLPLTTEGRARSRPDVARRAATDSSWRRVLVIDDDRDSADSLAIMVRSTGAQAHVAYDGPSGLAALPRFKPQLVLLDLGMPGMDGFETARRIRALPEGRELLLVALTGWGQPEDRARTRDAGFDRHLIKPLGPQALADLLAPRETAET